MHKNNFDFFRLIFAIFVLISHSYILSGDKGTDWLSQITNGQTELSYIGVRGFFIISGFLIYQSLLRSRSLYEYYWKRLLRIYPALIVMLLISVITCSFFYRGEIVSYIRDAGRYFFNNLTLYKVEYRIGNVFEKNPYSYAVNGSLWTLSYEFSLYMIISILFFTRKIKMFNTIALSIVFICCIVASLFLKERLDKTFFILNAGLFFELGCFFLAGSLLAALNFKDNQISNLLIIISLPVLVASLYFDFFYIAKYFALPLIVIGLGLKSTSIIKNTSQKVGDISYGIYIYGFFIQQVLMYRFNFNYLELMLYSLALVIIFASLSWHLVEKRALRLKNLFKLDVRQQSRVS
jgi:peptidoglycan/LPS O-acetylase OafA/YrhL